jgi:c-di-GMP-binding flagellar brake protein YcgR
MRFPDRAKFGSVEAKEMKNINRRESPRIEIKLQCHVSSPALWKQSAMYTENISRSGVLIAWRGVESELPIPAMGQIVTVEIELPANHGFGQKCIHCQGTVIRVTHSSEDFPWIALRVNYMDFRSFHDRIRAFESMRPVANSWMA